MVLLDSGASHSISVFEVTLPLTIVPSFSAIVRIPFWNEATVPAFSFS
jgi:hypothetical protein